MFTAGEGKLKTRCKTFPSLYVGVLLLNIRLKECKRETRQEDWSLSEIEVKVPKESERGDISRKGTFLLEDVQFLWEPGGQKM